MHDPREPHLQAAYRVLHYLKGQSRERNFVKNNNLTLEAYTDADYAGSLVGRRSTTGYCTFLGGNLVTWRSKKQKVVARSSAESEFRAIAQGLCELLWLKIILDDLRVKWEVRVFMILYSNWEWKTSIPQLEGKCRGVDIRLGELVEIPSIQGFDIRLGALVEIP
ncbi:hypothetical protein Acr_26g0001290 [Actinidia rufa]|uniref:Retrovirus-related Pol polyprotein from transposon RE1 n=1 Tax=Actinidia rufa TaxID=165716 RepID=A0A7J0H189_9ERIC|nr:hypothetical protein Acr_26g0001290 [Actinidia rufa]